MPARAPMIIQPVHVRHTWVEFAAVVAQASKHRQRPGAVDPHSQLIVRLRRFAMACLLTVRHHAAPVDPASRAAAGAGRALSVAGGECDPAFSSPVVTHG